MHIKSDAPKQKGKFSREQEQWELKETVIKVIPSWWGKGTWNL